VSPEGQRQAVVLLTARHGELITSANKRCVRVAEGGQVLATLELDRGCFACMLGGEDRRTLFMVVSEWLGPASMASNERTCAPKAAVARGCPERLAHRRRASADPAHAPRAGRRCARADRRPGQQCDKPDIGRRTWE
jgi:hypothetical protein